MVKLSIPCMDFGLVSILIDLVAARSAGDSIRSSNEVYRCSLTRGTCSKSVRGGHADLVLGPERSSFQGYGNHIHVRMYKESRLDE